MKFFFMLMILNGCATVAHGPYNTDGIQDRGCYSRFGGQHGYCDARSHR